MAFCKIAIAISVIHIFNSVDARVNNSFDQIRPDDGGNNYDVEDVSKKQKHQIFNDYLVPFETDTSRKIRKINERLGISLEAVAMSCEYKSTVIIISDETSSVYIDFLVRRMTDKIVASVVHYDLILISQNKMSMIDFLYWSYVERGVTEYLLVVSDPGEIMEKADTVFNQNKRGLAAAMPHRTKWIIFSGPTYNRKKTLAIDTLKTSHFDNLCVFSLVEKSNEIHLDNVTTLMWRMDRRRDGEKVNLDTLDGKQKVCSIFPNLKLGFNGRKFDQLTAFFLFDTFIKIPRDNDSNSQELSGLWYDVACILANSLNFTFNIRVWKKSWSKYRLEVHRGRTDIGLSLWRVNYFHKYPMSTTYPVFFRTNKGMYLQTTKLDSLFDERYSHYKTWPFPSVAIMIPFVCIVVSSVILVLLTKYNPGEERDSRQRTPYSGCPLTNNRRHFKFQHHHECAVLLFWAIGQMFAALLRQPLPQTVSTRTPPRIHMWAWCLTCVFFYALYTGMITSDATSPSEKPPFRTYDEMIDRGDYRWGTLNTSSIISLLKKSKNGTLHRLGKGIERVFDDTSDEDVFLQKIQQLLQGKFLLIHADSTLRLIREKLNCSSRLVIMKDSLLEYNVGFVLPINSEITDILSAKILELHDHGIIHKLENGYFHSENNISPQTFNSYVYKLKDTFPLNCIICICLAFSAFVLLCEIFMFNIDLMKRKKIRNYINARLNVSKVDGHKRESNRSEK